MGSKAPFVGSLVCIALRVRLPEGKQEILDMIDPAAMGEIGLRPEWMRAF
jgi:hypothetical protein